MQRDISGGNSIEKEKNCSLLILRWKPIKGTRQTSLINLFAKKAINKVVDKTRAPTILKQANKIQNVTQCLQDPEHRSPI